MMRPDTGVGGPGFSAGLRKLFIVAGVLACWSPAWGSDLEKAIRFGGGIIASVAIHEAGHLVAAKSTGNDIKFSGLQWTSERRSTLVKMAGLGANALSSEAILSTVPERGPFIFGILAGNLAREITYPIISGHRGDFRYLDSGKRILFRAFFVAHGLLTLWRASDNLVDEYNRSAEMFIAPVEEFAGAMIGVTWRW